MVPIPYALTYKTKMRGTMPKLVQCEQCQFEYVYMLKSTVEGQSTSMLFLDNQGAKERSATQAAEQLRSSLQKGCAVVPCPACGRIQDHMLPQARAQRYRPLALFGIILLCGAALIGLLSCVYTLAASVAKELENATLMLWAIAGGTAVGGVALLILKNVLAKRYDPNNTPTETRKQAGQRLAVSKEEFWKLANDNEGQ